MLKKFSSILKDIPSYSRFLNVREIDSLLEEIKNLDGVKYREIGKTIENEPIYIYELNSNQKKTALILGVPHSDEPLGSLVTTFFIRSEPMTMG